MLGFVERRLDTQVSGVGLGVFRIAYGCVLLLEVAQLTYFRHFFFDPIPYVSPRATDLTLAFYLWLAVVACLIFGALTRPAAIANYAFTLMSISRFSTYEYHHDSIIVGMNFLLMFLPVGRCLSVDQLIRRRRWHQSSSPEPRGTVSVLAYQVPVFLGIALVYFDSAIYKLYSPMWMAGLGLWQPASAPYATFVDWSWLLDQQFLVRALGFLVIPFEAAFIVLMWTRRARIPLLALGLALHLGLLFVFAIPLFALGVASLFLLLLPAGWWDGRPARGRAFRPVADAGRLHVASKRPTAIAISAFLAVLALSQAVCLLESPPLAPFTEAVRRTRVYTGWRGVARGLLGIQPHAVFMESRYGPYPQQFGVVHVDGQGNQIWLPVVSSLGHASFYSTGRQHTYWMHRVGDGDLQSERTKDGIRRLTAFWAHEHDVDLRDATFEIRVRGLKQAQGWEAGLLQHQYQ